MIGNATEFWSIIIIAMLVVAGSEVDNFATIFEHSTDTVQSSMNSAVETIQS